MPAAASNAKPASRAKRKEARLRSLSLGRGRSTRGCCASALRRAGRGRLMPHRRALRQRETFHLRRAVVTRVPAAASNAKSAATCKATTRAGDRGLWEGGAALEVTARVCRTALIVIDVGTIQGRSTGDRRGCFGAVAARRSSCTCEAQVKRLLRPLLLGRRRSKQAYCAHALRNAGWLAHAT